jgi:hypothetical protein
MVAVFMIVLPAAGLLLARANLRRRQGDRAGAQRVAVVFFGLFFAALVLRGHHSMRFVDEWIVTSWHVAQATFWALITATLYIALEPLVRRRWPQMLISWTRLLAGRYSDPMVGRDILLGAGGAAIAVTTWHMTLLIAGTSEFFTAPQSLGPARFAASVVIATLAEAILRGIGLVVLFVILRRFVRNDDAAGIVAILLVATMTMGDTFGPPWLRACYAVSASVCGVVLARHLGMLATIAYAFFILLQQRMPLTFDSDSWYFPRSVVVIVFLAALAAYAFRCSLGSKRFLPAFD